MAHCGLLAASIVAVVLAISFQESTALHCWQCSSDTSQGALCSDNFDPSVFPDAVRQNSYRQCPGSPLQSQQYGGRQACIKIKDRIGNRDVIRRECRTVYPNDAKDSCMHEQLSASLSREFCEICETDGCNGAAKYGPAVLFVIVSAAVAKFLSS